MKTRSSLVLLMLLGAAGSWAQEPQTPALAEIQAAAGRGEAEGMFQLARACLHGNGMPKDAAKSFEWMKAAADQGHADAIGGMGYFHSNGVVVERNEKEAARWFRKGAELGSAKARLNLAKLLLAGKTGTSPEAMRSEGLMWLKKAADQGLPDAELVYGSVLYFGEHGVTRDHGKALPYLKHAAENGLSEAQNTVGLMYQLGLGTEPDPKAAEQWFRKAALNGHLKAQSNLGRILDPLSNNRDTRMEALAWLLTASGRGEITATKSLEDAAPGLNEGELAEAGKMAAGLRKQIRWKRPGA